MAESLSGSSEQRVLTWVEERGNWMFRPFRARRSVGSMVQSCLLRPYLSAVAAKPHGRIEFLA